MSTEAPRQPADKDDFVTVEDTDGSDEFMGEDRYGKFFYKVSNDGEIMEGGTTLVMSSQPNARWDRFKNDHPADARRLLNVAEKRKSAS